MGATQRRLPRQPQEADHDQPRPSPRRLRWIGLLVVVIFLALAARVGISLLPGHLESAPQRRDETGEPSRTASAGESSAPPIVLPGEPTPLTVQQMHAELAALAENIMDVYPADAGAMLVAGMVNSELQQTEVAIAWLEKCVDEPAAGEEAFVGLAKNLALLGEHDRAIEVLQRALARGKVSPAVVSRLAETLADTGRMRDAVAVLRHGVERYSENAQLWLQLGQALIQLQEFGPAESCVRRSIQLGKQDRSALIALSTCLLRQGKQEAALQLRRELASLSATAPPDDPNVTGAMAGGGQTEGFQAGLTEKSRAASVQIFCAAANVYSQHGDLATAQSLLMRSIELGPDEPSSYRSLAALLHRAQRISDAMIVVGRLTQLEPEVRQHYENLASMSASSGQFAQAEDLIDNTLQLHPDAGMPRFGMALVLMAQQRYQAAREYAEAAAQRLQTADAYLLLLANLRALNDRAAFQQAQQRAREVAPHDARLRNIHF